MEVLSMTIRWLIRSICGTRCGECQNPKGKMAELFRAGGMC